MAFTCQLTAPDLGAGQQLVLTAWLAEPRSMISKGDPLFSISVGGTVRVFVSNMPCLLAEQRIAAGSTIGPGQVIGVAWAEGEDIPHGRPYVSAQNGQD